MEKNYKLEKLKINNKKKTIYKSYRIGWFSFHLIFFKICFFLYYCWGKLNLFLQKKKRSITIDIDRMVNIFGLPV